MELAQKIKQLRLQLDLQQQDVATYMGLTRQTYALVEKGAKDLTLPQLEKLAGFLHTSVIELLYGARILDDKALNMSRYTQILLNALYYGANEWGSIMKLKLANLVYLIDFEWYRKNGSSMIGGSYLRYINGPFPDHFYWALDMLYEQHELGIEHRAGTVVVSSIEKPSRSELKPQEVAFIKEVARKWQQASTSDLRQYVHKQVSWKYAHTDMFVPYELLASR